MGVQEEAYWEISCNGEPVSHYVRVRVGELAFVLKLLGGEVKKDIVPEVVIITNGMKTFFFPDPLPEEGEATWKFRYEPVTPDKARVKMLVIISHPNTKLMIFELTAIYG